MPKTEIDQQLDNLSAQMRDIRLHQKLNHLDVLKGTNLQPARFEAGLGITLKNFLILANFYGFEVALKPLKK